MARWQRIGWVGFGAGLLGVLVQGQTVPTSGTRAASTPATARGAATAPAVVVVPVDLSVLRPLVAELASGDAQRRLIAQRQLEEVGAEQRDVLVGLAGEATDAEIKQRLLGRVKEMDQRQAYDPPRFTLDMSDVTLKEINAAIKKAAGFEISEVSSPSVKFDLHVANASIWDVVEQLEQQHSFTGLGVVGGHTMIAQRYGMAVVAEAPELSNDGRDLSWLCEVVADPRVRILQYGVPEFEIVTDDRGNNLLEGAVRMVESRGPRKSLFPRLVFNNVRSMGTKVAYAKGRVRVLVGVETKALTVENPEKHEGEKYTLGLADFRLSSFDVSGSRPSYYIEIATKGVAALAKEASISVPRPLMITLIDATGKREEIGSFGTNMAGASNGSLKAPLKMEFSGVATYTEVAIPFEMNDLPLPKLPASFFTARVTARAATQPATRAVALPATLPGTRPATRAATRSIQIIR